MSEMVERTFQKREDFVRAYLRMRDTPESIRIAAEVKLRRQYSDARNEHALLLRCEGYSYKEIGARLGVSGSFGRTMMQRAAAKLNFAMRRMKVSK